MGQRSIDWVYAASPEQIDRAMRAGDLDALLRGEQVVEPPNASSSDIAEWNRYGDQLERQIANADLGARGERLASGRRRLAGMTPEQLVSEYKAGRLDDFLRGEADH